MKGFKILLSIFAISFLNLASAEYSTTTSNWYNTPIIDWSIEFKAEQDNWKVYMEWTVYNGDEKFKFYKVSRSQTVESPVYPDNGYIKYSSDINLDNYTDYKAPNWINFYRVCAITYENNRYCSNVVKIDYKKIEEKQTVCTMEYAPVCGKKGWKLKTYSNKCMLNIATAQYKYYWKCKEEAKISNSSLDYKIRLRSDQLVKKFIYAIDKKWLTNNEKINTINKIIKKLNGLKDSKPKLANVIDYIVLQLEKKLEEYKNDFSDIESIFWEY